MKKSAKLKGFTLIEIIITMALTSIVIIPLALMVNQHIQSLVQSENYTMAMNLARLQLETVNNTAYVSISSATLNNYLGYSYDLTQTVTFAQGTGVSAESLKQIQIDARKSGSSTILVSLITYIAKNVTYGL